MNRTVIIYTVLTVVLGGAGYGITQINLNSEITVIEQEKYDAQCFADKECESRKKYFTNGLNDLDVNDGKGF